MSMFEAEQRAELMAIAAQNRREQEPRVVSYHNDHGVVTAEVVMLHGYYAVELFTGPEEATTEFYTVRRDAHAVAKCHTERYS